VALKKLQDTILLEKEEIQKMKLEIEQQSRFIANQQLELDIQKNKLQ
jgi:hypothetical protein